MACVGNPLPTPPTTACGLKTYPMLTRIRLLTFQEVSDSSALSEGGNWASTLLGSKVSESERETAFDRLTPGRRPDTIVLRGVPANWLGERGRAAEGTCAPVRNAYAVGRALEENIIFREAGECLPPREHPAHAVGFREGREPRTMPGTNMDRTGTKRAC